MGFNGGQTLIAILTLAVGGLVFRLLTKWKDSESTSRTDDASEEENEALRRDSESTSRTDHGSGEENETFNPLGIEQQGSNTTDQMKRNRSSEAIQSMDNMPTYQYDVFLSFCGRDTRRTFTDNLYYRMRDVGIHIFLDSEELEDGERINEVLEAVDKSRIYIPIFSQNFASRPWCLREVARMVERHSEPDEKRDIIPIFYDVEPNDVKLRTDLYKKDILEHKRKGYFKPGEPEQWERALKEVGSMMGRELIGKRQGEEIESIVKEVLSKLGKHVDLPGDLVEDYPQIKAIIEKLDLNSGGVRFVGIHGIGGIGKTTLAKVVFKKLSSRFDRVSFLDDVRKSSENGLVNLQKKLLTSVGSSSHAEKIQDIGEGMYWIEAVCKTRKVLIVLDDLDNKEQLIKLAGKYSWFGSGSRIIITTRDESILMTPVESTSKEDRNRPEGILCYAVHEMVVDQALQLFYKHAFRSDSPIEDYVALSKDIVCKVGKLPLAIEVIGSYLYDLGNLGPYGDHKELWKETLKKLDEGPFKSVRDVLMISYKGLEDKQKEVFLDIACFFTNEDQAYPVIMWDDCDYYPHTAICILRLRSLIKIIDDKFWMHDQVRDLGRHIILKEHIPKFSRVWKHEDVAALLKKKKRNEDVEALSLTFSGCNHNFTDEELAALSKLRFLRAKGSDFSGDFKNLLPELRWLSWQTQQTNVQENFLAKNFHLSKLVVLSLSDSDIKDDWGGWSQMKMNKLKVLDLTGCMHLQRTPNFSNFTSLETLILARCVKLTTIDRSIGMLKLLKTFNINRCRDLQELPEEFGSLQSLKEIIMPQNYQPFKLPETIGNLQSLSGFILDEHPGINRLPNSIGGLVKLTRLSLRGCVGIEELPCSIGDMEMLAELDLSNSGIVELPDSIGSLKKLKVIMASCTRIKKFPRTIGQLEMLEELRANKCWYLTDENLEEIEKLSNLKRLDISYTDVSKYPTVLGCLDRLEMLKMISREVQEVPDLPPSLTHLCMQAPHFPSLSHLSSLVNLDYLELSLLTKQEEKTGSIVGPNIAWTNDLLPSSLSTLKVRGILLPPFSNLKKLSEMFIIEYPMSEFSVSQDLTNLRILKLRKCLLLEKIPGLSHLKNLQCLDLNGLESLVEIHDLLELKSLEHFRIAHCKKIEWLPNLSDLKMLRHIEIEACPKITEIKGVNGPERLKLDTPGCTVLDKLMDDRGSTWLSHKKPTYDVFVSFRGPDTRYNIVEILYKNLVHKQILVYRDYEPVSHGYGISNELMLAFADSHIYIPVLSPNYASSRWCLYELAQMVQRHESNELAHMVQRQKSNGRRILPIFYNVEKHDVMLESDLYRRDLDNQRKIYPEEVDEWENALRCVGNMDGYNLKTNSLEEVIYLVTEEVLGELGYAGIRRPQEVED